MRSWQPARRRNHSQNSAAPEHSGEIEKSQFVTDPTFGVQVPTSIEGVPSELLIPENTWEDKAAYQASCKKLASSLVENFKKYTHMSDEVVAAGPKA